MSVLEIRDLTVDLPRDDGRTVSAVAGVSLEIGPGEVFGLVGESGCGKSTVAAAIVGLLAAGARREGSIRLHGDELTELPERRLRALRGDRLAMIVQDPRTALDPSCAIGEQIAETIRAHRPVDRRTARAQATELLRDVGFADPEARYGARPHELSGGMRQRVVIAAALANDPALLIADEPTTALDATVQAQILDLIRAQQARHGTSVLLIAHDLGVVAQLCDRVGVLYAGRLVEVAPTAELLRNPRHPYTRALLDALPREDVARGALRTLQGVVPDLTDPPAGCRFAPRCPAAHDACVVQPPERGDDTHRVACWLPAADPALPLAEVTR